MFTLQAAAHTNKLLSYASSLLLKKHSVPALQEQATLLSGDHNSILLLTRHFQENFDLDERPYLKAVCLTGRQLTTRWRNEIAECFRTSVIDRYSLSEIFGGATFCHQCKGYHFDPQVVPEIVKSPLSSGQPVSTGTGYLVLTTLAPFVWNQPFVRYLTGDLFSVEDCGCAEKSFYPLGRATQALLSTHLTSVSESTVVLSIKDLMDVLDSVPGLCRPETFRDVSLVREKDINFPYVRGRVDVTESGPAVAIQLSMKDQTTGMIDAAHIPKGSLLSPLAKLLHDRVMDPFGVACRIELIPESGMTSLEKNSTLWVNSPQK